VTCTLGCAGEDLKLFRLFGFREFLRHRGEEPTKPVSRVTPPEGSLLTRRFRESLEVGGFPEAQGLDASLRIPLLQGYVDTLIVRDVVERYQVSQVGPLRWLVRFCLRNPAAAMSVHKLYRDPKSQGYAVSKDTLHALLSYLEDAFLIKAIYLDTDSERQRNTNPRKVYPVDVGLIQAYGRSGRPHLALALETTVLQELLRRGAAITYVKTKERYEVDFLARIPGQVEQLIQVCAAPTLQETFAREVRALQAAAVQYRHAERVLVVMTSEQASQLAGQGIRVRPAYEWFLGSAS